MIKIKTNYIFKKRFFSICVFFLILFSNCKKEASITTQNDYQVAAYDLKALVNKVKIWHDSVVSSMGNSNNENNVKSLSLSPDDIVSPVIDWDLAFKNFDSINVKSLTVPLKYNISTGELLQLVATSRMDSVNGYLVRQLPDSTYYAGHPDILDMSGFTGNYMVYDLLGHCLAKVNFKGGTVTSNSSNTSHNGNTNSNVIGPPCAICDLTTVIVTGYIRNSLNDLTRNISGLGAFAITTYNGNYNGAYTSYVVAGGGSIYNSTLTSLVSIPNGECVFGSLAYVGKLIGWVSNPDTYIDQWTKMKGLSLSTIEMKYKLDNVQTYRPGFKDAEVLLYNNFDAQPLKSYDDVLSAVKNNYPVFVLMNWGDGTGHCVVLGWDSNNNSLYYFDSIDDSHNLIKVGDDYYSKIKYFYKVNGPNYIGS
jgi:hypothetical protein